MKDNEYKCDICKNVYQKGWSNEEAKKECEESFGVGSSSNENNGIVCDDCYNDIIKPSLNGNENNNIEESLQDLIQIPEYCGEEILEGLLKKILNVTAVHGFMNIWFAANNMPLPRIVNSVFDKSERQHILDILEKSSYDFFSFIGRMDERNRGRIILWINEHYNGLDFSYIKKYYLQH